MAQSIREGGRSCESVQWPPADDEELVAMDKKYRREHELREIDRELGLETPEEGRALMLAAEADLRSRGINLDDASQEQLLDALTRVGP